MLTDFLNTINWQPKIGDPSILGWLTVVFYFITSFLGFIIAFTFSRKIHFHFWITISIFLFILGINKQLDIQSLFTEIGRVIAKTHGWYENRRSVQSVFILLIILIGSIATLITFWLLRNEWNTILIPLIGLLFLITFIVVRAASFHHVDQLLKKHTAGIPVNWILELGGIGIIFCAELLESKMIFTKKRNA